MSASSFAIQEDEAEHIDPGADSGGAGPVEGRDPVPSGPPGRPTRAPGTRRNLLLVVGIVAVVAVLLVSAVLLGWIGARPGMGVPPTGAPDCHNGCPLERAVDLQPPTYSNASGQNNETMYVAAVNATVPLGNVSYSVLGAGGTPVFPYNDLIARAANGTFLGDASSQSGGAWITGAQVNLTSGDTLTLESTAPLHGDAFILAGLLPYSGSISFVLP